MLIQLKNLRFLNCLIIISLSITRQFLFLIFAKCIGLLDAYNKHLASDLTNAIVAHLFESGLEFNTQNIHDTLIALVKINCILSPDDCSFTAPKGPLTAMAGSLLSIFLGSYKSAASVMP